METERIIETLERMEKDQRDFFARIESILISYAMTNEQWIDSVEVERLLGVSTKTVYRLCQNGTLMPIRLGRRNYFHRPAIFELRKRIQK